MTINDCGMNAHLAVFVCVFGLYTQFNAKSANATNPSSSVAETKNKLKGDLKGQLIKQLRDKQPSYSPILTTVSGQHVDFIEGEEFKKVISDFFDSYSDTIHTYNQFRVAHCKWFASCKFLDWILIAISIYELVALSALGCVHLKTSTPPSPILIYIFGIVTVICILVVILSFIHRQYWQHKVLGYINANNSL